MTKIDIFSGFLGAGKTTLIKKLIAEAYAGERLVLIENEFGEIGIDGGFLQDAGINITEMNSGCICCSLVGDFGRALEKVLDEYHPDRILIEPSGVGKLSDVIRAVEGIDRADAVLNTFTTVADASKCKMYMKNFGEFFNDQIENASTIVLSHTAHMTDEKIAAAVALLREHNAKAAVITTDWELLDGAQILRAMEKTDSLASELAHLAEEEHSHHHNHHHDEDEHEHHHHDGECCHHHHDEDEHEHHHHDGECCHHHHDEGEHEHHHHDGECCHHHHDEDEHEHHGHHHHHDGEECHDPNCGCHHHHHADEVFISCGAETTKRFTVAEITAALEAFAEDSVRYGMVLRAKGIVENAEGGWLHFDYVPGEPDVRVGSAGVIGRLCVIGADLNIGEINGAFGVELKA